MGNKDMIKETFFNLFPIQKAIDVEYIRLGSKNDGGYINVNDISKNDFSISFGISYNVDWEKDFIEYGKGIDCYDNSVDGLIENIHNSRFFKKTVGSEISLNDCIKNTNWTKDFILKMDIEGGEWDVFRDASVDDLKKFRQIVVEYHWLIDKINSKEYYLIKSCFDKINETHVPVWIHANNYAKHIEIDKVNIPDVVEVLYLRKSDYKFKNFNSYKEYLDIFNNLDMPNDKKSEEILVNFYGS
jgi:hypothetical protein